MKKCTTKMKGFCGLANGLIKLKMEPQMEPKGV